MSQRIAFITISVWAEDFDDGDVDTVDEILDDVDLVSVVDDAIVKAFGVEDSRRFRVASGQE